MPEPLHKIRSIPKAFFADELMEVQE